MIDYEQLVQRVYESILRPGMVAVDVGAHIGRHGFEMARLVAPGGHVHLFEPLPAMLAKLRARIKADAALLAVTTVYPYAISNSSGVTDFCVATDALAYSGIKERRYDTETAVARIQVEVRRLDDVLAAAPRIDYIKIDTEGAEWNVIQGGAALIAKFRPVITFEFGENSYSAYGVEPEAVHAFFAAQDYRVYDICGRELDSRSFVESSIHQQVWDYVAIPPTNRDLATRLQMA